MIVPVTFNVKVGKTGNSLRITIPIPILRTLNIKEGDILGMQLTNGEILVRKLDKENES